MIRKLYSIWGIVLAASLIVLLPAFVLILYTGKEVSQDAVARVSNATIQAAHDVAQEQQQVVERTRLLLLTLSRLERVRQGNAIERLAEFQPLLAQFPSLQDLRLCDKEGKTLFFLEGNMPTLSPNELQIIRSAAQSSRFQVRSIVSPDAGVKLICTYPVRVEGIIRYSLVAFLEMQQPETVPALQLDGLSYVAVKDNIGHLARVFGGEGLSDWKVAKALDGLGSDTELHGFYHLDSDDAEQVVALESLRISDFDAPYLHIFAVSEPSSPGLVMREMLLNPIGMLSMLFCLVFAGVGQLTRQWLLAPLTELSSMVREIEMGGHLPGLAPLKSKVTEFLHLEEVFHQLALAQAARTEKLIGAKRAVDQASQSKSDFLANMSHEIRTPMNAILGMAYLAQRTQLDAKQRSYIGTIHAEVSSLLLVINDILDFSKLEAGRLQLEHIFFDLRGVLKSLLEDGARRASEKGVLLSWNISDAIPPVLQGDGFYLRQAVAHFLDNALAYTDHGQIRLTAGVSAAQGSKFSLAFTLTDTGKGMTPEQQAKFFMPGDDDHARLEGSSGLSILVAKRLLHLMGGSLEVTSQVGKGTTVSFYLPLEASGGEVVLGRGASAYRALLLCQFADRADGVVSVLRAAGVDIILAYTLRELYHRLQAEDAKRLPFHFVFLEEHYLFLDGASTSRTIQAELGLTSIPGIILLASGNLDSSVPHPEQLGVDAFLYPPVRLDAMCCVLQSTLLQSGQLVQPDETLVDDEAGHSGQRGCVFSGERVLVVDDTRVNRQILREILEGFGLSVDLAHNGEEALRFVKEANHAPYRAILMDLQMPGMDGFEATRAIRKLAGCGRLPIIAMTAHSKRDEWERCRQAGFDDYAAKPVNVEELNKTLHIWIALTR